MEQVTRKAGGGRRAALWTSAAVVAIALAGGAIYKTTLQRSINEHIAQRGGKAGSVEVDFLGSIHLRDVTLPVGHGAEAHIAAIDGRPRFLFWNGSLSVENLTGEFAGIGVSVPRATVEEANFDRQSLAEMFGGRSALPLAQRVERFSAKRIALPEVVVSQTIAGGVNKTTYTNLTFDDIANGHVARYAAERGAIEFDTTVPDKDEDGQARKEHVSGTIGAISGKDLDAAYVARLYTEKADGKDNPARPVHGPFSIKDLAWSLDDASFKYDEIRSDGFSMRMPAEPFLDTIAKLRAVAETPDPARAELNTAFASLMSLADAIDKGNAEMLGLHIEGPSKDKSQTIHFDVDRIATRLDNRTLDASINGISMGEGNDYVKLGEASISGFSWAPTAEAMKKFLALDEEQAEAFPFATLLPEFGTIRVAGLDVDVPHSDTAAVEDLNPLGAEESDEPETEIAAPEESEADAGAAEDSAGIEEGAGEQPEAAETEREEQAAPAVPERVRLSLKSYEMALNKLYNGIPTDIRIAYDDLTLPVPENSSDEVYQQLRKLGYDKLTMSSKVEGAWDEANQNFVVKEMSVSGPEMGSISLSGIVGGVTGDIFSGDVTRTQVAALGLKAREVELRVEEKGLIARALALYAAENGTTVEDLRSSVALIAAAMLQEVASSQPGLEQATAALSSFLAKPNVLSVKVRSKSKAGIGLFEFVAASEDPMSLLDKVDIDARAE